MGASSFSPSPITTIPSIGTVSSISRIASTAAWSASSFSPRPTQRAAASAAASVTRTSSSARLRSGVEPERTSCEMTPTRVRLDGAGGLADPPLTLLRAAEARTADHERRYERDPVAPVEADADLRLAGARLVDDSVVDDEDRGREAGHHRHLAGRPGQL